MWWDVEEEERAGPKVPINLHQEAIEAEDASDLRAI